MERQTEKGERIVWLAGMPLALHYTVNSMCAVEDAVGGALDEVFDRQFTAARLLLWGGMLDRQPGMTLDQAGELVGRHLSGGGTLEEIVEHCAEGLRRAGFFAAAQ